MPTTTEQIDLWRKSPSENQRLEFKEAKSQLDNRKINELPRRHRERARGQADADDLR